MRIQGSCEIIKLQKEWDDGPFLFDRNHCCNSGLSGFSRGGDTSMDSLFVQWSRLSIQNDIVSDMKKSYTLKHYTLKHSIDIWQDIRFLSGKRLKDSVK